MSFFLSWVVCKRFFLCLHFHSIAEYIWINDFARPFPFNAYMVYKFLRDFVYRVACACCGIVCVLCAIVSDVCVHKRKSMVIQTNAHNTTFRTIAWNKQQVLWRYVLFMTVAADWVVVVCLVNCLPPSNCPLQLVEFISNIDYTFHSFNIFQLNNIFQK